MRKKIKILSFVLVAVLILSVQPITTFAATSVTTAAELISAAESGGEITLESSIYFTEFDTIDITKDTVINLNGHQIALDNSYMILNYSAELENLFVVSGATLTINGSNYGGSITYNGTNSVFELVGVENKATKLILNNFSLQTYSVWLESENGFAYPESLVKIEAAQGTTVPELQINGGSYSVVSDENNSNGKIVTGNDTKVKVVAGNFGTDVSEYLADNSIIVEYQDGSGYSVYDVATEVCDEVKTLLNEKGELVLKRYKPEDYDGIIFALESIYYDSYEKLSGTHIFPIFETYNAEGSYVYAEVCDENGNRIQVIKLPLVFEYDESVKTEIDKIIASLPKGEENYEGGTAYTYKVNDLELINYWRTCTVDDDNINALINYSDEFKQYIGYKNFCIDTRYGDGNWFYTLGGGIGEFKYNGTVYGIEHLEVKADHIIYVADDTANTTEALLKAAQERIDGYLGESKVELKYKDTLLEIMLKETYEGTRYEWEQVLGQDATYDEWKQSAFCPSIDVKAATGIAEVTDTTPVFETIINDVPYILLIMKDSSKMVTPKYQNVEFGYDISVSSDNSEIPLDTILEVEKLTGGEEYDKIISVLNPEDSETYDIKLYSGSIDDYVTQLSNGMFEVKIPIPERFNGKTLKVFYVNANGESNEYDVKAEDGFAVFQTNHFSAYTLTATSVGSDETENQHTSSDTSDSTGINLWAMLSLISGMLLLVTICGKRKFEI